MSGEGAMNPHERLFAVSNLVVKYGRLLALEVDHLEVPPGRILVVGANASGKTTLIKTLLGLIKPSRGRVELLGRDPFKHSSELSRLVTYVRDVDELSPQLKLSTLIEVLGESFGRESVESIASDLGLHAHTGKRLGELSKGMRRKASLLMALASNRELVIIDEPFSGLDSKSRITVAQLLDTKKSHMIIVSHIPLRIRFDHLIVVESGRVTYSGPYRELEYLEL